MTHEQIKERFKTRFGMMGYLANFHSQPINTNQSAAPVANIAMIDSAISLHSRHANIFRAETETTLDVLLA